jgi:hypothetical protein
VAPSARRAQTLPTTGRHTGLKIRCLVRGVPVQVWPGAPFMPNLPRQEAGDASASAGSAARLRRNASPPALATPVSCETCRRESSGRPLAPVSVTLRRRRRRDLPSLPVDQRACLREGRATDRVARSPRLALLLLASAAPHGRAFLPRHLAGPCRALLPFALSSPYWPSLSAVDAHLDPVTLFAKLMPTARPQRLPRRRFAHNEVHHKTS